MSGHSKWSQIKHKKAITDSRRGKAFTKLIKEISICARLGGGDPNGNARLRLLLDKAKEINMPIDNAIRAIKRGTGELPGVNYEPYSYEGYGPGNIAIVIDALTDNKNRTVAELRHMFSSHGGNLADSGSVSWMFSKQGVIRIQAPNATEDDLLEALIEFDMYDVQKDSATISLYCEPKSLDIVKQKLIELGYTIDHAEIEWVAKNCISLDNAASEKAYEFLHELQDHDDIQNVYTNLA